MFAQYLPFVAETSTQFSGIRCVPRCVAKACADHDQGFLSPGDRLKALENKQKTLEKTKEFRIEKKTKETSLKNTKEKKDRFSNP